MPITITVPAVELFDANTNMFSSEPAYKLELEHSLVSLSKWEQKYKKPFLGKEEKSTEEAYGYIHAMCLDPDVPLSVIHRIDNVQFKLINDYIDDPQTATWFSDAKNGKPNREVVTNELIYHWMVAMTIPLDRENWHLNRLFTLIKVINIKNAPPKKQSRAELAARHRELNAANKARMGSQG